MSERSRRDALAFLDSRYHDSLEGRGTSSGGVAVFGSLFSAQSGKRRQCARMLGSIGG